MKKFVHACLIAIFAFSAVAFSSAETKLIGCSFSFNGTIMTLDADCMTDQSLVVPNGFTMDLRGNTVVAVDPAGDHFRSGVIRNGGSSATVRNGTIVAGNLANVCDAGDDRLRGVLFDGASGVITGITVESLNQGASGCQEGNGIEARNAPFDGTHPHTVTVEITHNRVYNWQKTGIVVNGDVVAQINNNFIGASATQANLAANSLQIGSGAKAIVERNHIAGNSWCCSNTVATSVLLFSAAEGTVVRQNELMVGNSDVGIYVFANGVTVDNNKIFETGEDTNAFGYDIALGDYGSNNTITNNKAKGYATPYDGSSPEAVKAIPAPSKQ